VKVIWGDLIFNDGNVLSIEKEITEEKYKFRHEKIISLFVTELKNFMKGKGVENEKQNYISC
jgi:hypothetical protein